MKKTISSGALKSEMTTKVVTWFSRAHGKLVSSVIVYDQAGKEAQLFTAAWMRSVDPVAAHRLHRLLAAMSFIDAEGTQLGLASAAATVGCEGSMAQGIDALEAQEQLRTQLCDGYDTAVSRHSDDVAGDIRALRKWGLDVALGTVSQEVVAGRIAFTEELGALGILSPAQHEAREQAREAVLAPLRPHLLAFSQGLRDTAEESVKSLENNVLFLAARGIDDPELLLGYAIYQRLAANEKANEALEGMFGMGFGSLFDGLMGGMFGGARERHKPNWAGEAALYARTYLGENPNRDDQWLRWAIAGIANDLSRGGKPLKDVVRNDLL